MKPRLLALVYLYLTLHALDAEPEFANAEAPLKDDAYTSPRAEWFRKARYGMFIHWGLYMAD